MTENVNRNIPPELSDEDAELLSAYLDDMLTTAERETLDARLATDAFLRAELEAMRRTVNWLNNMPQLQAPHNFTISADAVAQDPPPNVVVMPRRNLWLSAAAAAIVVVLFGIVFVAGTMFNAEVAAPMDSAARNTGGASAQMEVAVAATATASTTSIATPLQTQNAFVVAPTAGFALSTATQNAPQTFALPTGTPLADIAMVAEATEPVEEAEADDAATGETDVDEQAAESGLAQSANAATVVIEATQTAVTVLEEATQSRTERLMTVTALPSPTAAPTQAPSTEAAPMVADSANSSVPMTATSLAMLYQATVESTMEAATTTLQQSQATGGQTLSPTGTVTGIDAITLKDDVMSGVRRIVLYLLLRFAEFIRTAP